MARILVVEDEPALAICLTNDLKLEGYEVEVARDGETAALKGQQPELDLILLDVMLPRKDGFEVCRELRRETPLGLAPCASSGFTVFSVMRAMVAHEVPAGVTWYLDELLSLVLRRGPVPAESARALHRVAHGWGRSVLSAVGPRRAPH
jgi:CheY-like chemotaxis protein